MPIGLAAPKLCNLGSASPWPSLLLHLSLLGLNLIPSPSLLPAQVVSTAALVIILLTDVSLDVVRSFSSCIRLPRVHSFTRKHVASSLPPSTLITVTRSEIVPRCETTPFLPTPSFEPSLLDRTSRRIPKGKLITAKIKRSRCATQSNPWCWPPSQLAKHMLPRSAMLPSTAMPESTTTCNLSKSPHQTQVTPDE